MDPLPRKLSRSLISAGILLAGEKYLPLTSAPQEIFDKNGAFRAGQAAAASLVSSYIGDSVILALHATSPYFTAIRAVTGGGLYTATNYFTKFDSNNLLYSFLWSTGSNLISEVLLPRVPEEVFNNHNTSHPILDEEGKVKSEYLSRLYESGVNTLTQEEVLEFQYIGTHPERSPNEPRENPILTYQQVWNENHPR